MSIKQKKKINVKCFIDIQSFLLLYAIFAFYANCNKNPTKDQIQSKPVQVPSVFICVFFSE